MERDLTTGSIGRNILKFSLPYFLSYFLQTLYGMADLFIIGQFNGVASTTAVSIGSQVMHMITVMIVGIAMGTTVMIGKSVGAKQKKETSKIIGNTCQFVCMSFCCTYSGVIIFCSSNCSYHVNTATGSRRNNHIFNHMFCGNSFDHCI